MQSLGRCQRQQISWAAILRHLSSLTRSEWMSLHEERFLNNANETVPDGAAQEPAAPNPCGDAKVARTQEIQGGRGRGQAGTP
jgi:hypothetical protein